MDTEGYKIVAHMGWAPVEEDGELGGIGGTMGACVEGLNADFLTVADGNPVVCHFIDATGNDVNALSLVTLSYDEWDEGNWSVTPDNVATNIPEEYKPVLDDSALKTAAKIRDSIATSQDETEEVVDDADADWGDGTEVDAAL